MLAVLLAAAGDVVGSYALLRLTHRWWIMVPGAIVIGMLSGAGATLALGLLFGADAFGVFAGMIRAAMLHAGLTIPGIFWLRWWLTPMR